MFDFIPKHYLSFLFVSFDVLVVVLNIEQGKAISDRGQHVQTVCKDLPLVLFEVDRSKYETAGG